MKTRYHTRFPGIAALLLFAGCAGAPSSQQVSAADDGARIWRMTCARCHNLRPVPEFAAEQWPIIVSHMRTRADLTKSDAEAVATFLQGVADRSAP